MKFGTKVIHAGIKPDPSTGAIMTPIYQTSTFVQSEPGVHKGFEYSRTQNPTRKVLEANLASLENGKHGLVFASGLAAMDTFLKLFLTVYLVCLIVHSYCYTYITKVTHNFSKKKRRQQSLDH